MEEAGKYKKKTTHQARYMGKTFPGRHKKV